VSKHEPICPRCLVGVDDDGDGNCTLCAGLTQKQAFYLCLRASILALRYMQSARDAAFEEMRMHLSVTSIENPLVAIDAYRLRYPRHGDFDRERLEEQAQTAPLIIDSHLPAQRKEFWPYSSRPYPGPVLAALKESSCN
jgi:hypothetical protein